MSSGLIGGFYNALVGKPNLPNFNPSGSYQGIEGLGKEYSDFLLNRLKTPATDTKEFGIYSQTIRDMLARETGSAKQSLSDSATAGGFFDSGARPSALADITRSGQEAFGSSLNELILGLEARRTAEVLPYLSGAAQENLGLGNLELGKRGLEEQGRNNNLQHFASVYGSTAGAVSGGFGGGVTG